MAIADKPDELDAGYWAKEFDAYYDIPNENYLDQEKIDDITRRLQVVLDRLREEGCHDAKGRAK